MAFSALNDDLIAQLNTASRKLTALLDDQLRPLNLSASNYYLLLKIDAKTGLTQDQLYRRIYLSPSNVTRRLDQLINLGFVRKVKTATDRRAWRVLLTNDGAHLIDKINEQLQHVNDLTFSGLSSTDLTALSTMLDTIDDNLSENSVHHN
ncbi:Transcriptional regulator MarR family [Furfurilactobacillus rossiae]|uniref:MarR family winged helix-turn-helix transcriptional regulator n=1 Tax=Furfurilactobacillus rossiae TaxID=231049 RepID=UPI0015B9B7EA|nr:MarR family transcriptional regulator [Furfurilactobacillus rossiae]MCF6165435.1 MarR family transcriptional regulator [Furfurilactobacillus rossiae]QLE64275.1 Transcriptional regulator MarR family [Furfurilactobacillus rossiae]